jgi:pimeloyl-ACP methyl ester carboxylesterase
MSSVYDLVLPALFYASIKECEKRPRTGSLVDRAHQENSRAQDGSGIKWNCMGKMSQKRKWYSRMFSLLSTLAAVYLGLIILLVLFQRNLIYFPSRAGESQLIQSAGREGLIPWRDSKGQIIGWRNPSAGTAIAPRVRLVVFHGNAGFALHRTYYVEGFHSIPGGKLRWEVYLFEYPGYGARSGTASETAILDAAREALNELQQEDAKPLYLLGESLGSGVASRLAADNPSKVAGLILVTPFTCLSDVGAAHYGIFPVRMLLRDKYEVQRHLASYPGPVAFLMAGQDEIVPARIGRELFDCYSGRKRLWTQPQAGHNTLSLSPGDAWWREVTSFLVDSKRAE